MLKKIKFSDIPDEEFEKDIEKLAGKIQVYLDEYAKSLNENTEGIILLVELSTNHSINVTFKYKNFIGASVLNNHLEKLTLASKISLERRLKDILAYKHMIDSLQLDVSMTPALDYKLINDRLMIPYRTFYKILEKDNYKEVLQRASTYRNELSRLDENYYNVPLTDNYFKLTVKGKNYFLVEFFGSHIIYNLDSEDLDVICDPEYSTILSKAKLIL